MAAGCCSGTRNWQLATGSPGHSSIPATMPPPSTLRPIPSSRCFPPQPANPQVMATFCDICTEDFGSVVDLMRHCINTTRHSYCIHCHRTFWSPGDLEKHLGDSEAHRMPEHASIQPSTKHWLLDPYIATSAASCGKCKRSLKTEQHLDQHIRCSSSHADDSPTLVDFGAEDDEDEDLLGP